MPSSGDDGGDGHTGRPMADDGDTPLMRQWREVKTRHRDALVFFRVGDFYELFYEDAREAAGLLGLTLTSRNNGAAAEVPMAGVPARALDEYMARVVEAGRRAAVCDQVEDASEAQGIVRRQVTETVSPGTVLQDALLEAERNNFLVALAPGSEGGRAGGMAALDLSTGELILQPVPPEGLGPELGRLEPSELLVPRAWEAGGGLLDGVTSEAPTTTYRDDWLFDAETAREEVQRRYRVSSLDGLGFQPDDGPLVRAAGALLQYLDEIRPEGFEHLRPPEIRRPGREMVLDEMTRRNLELVRPLRPEEEGGTLLSVLDETATAMGSRLLRQWILRPLVEVEPIWRRQEAVAVLVADPTGRRDLRAALDGMGDLERLAGKLGSGRASPRELLALGKSLARLPDLRDGVRRLAEQQGEAEPDSARLLADLAEGVDPLEDVAKVLEEGIHPEAPPNLQEGGVIRPGHSQELDELRGVRDGARDFIASLEARERERTGINSLKVGHNKVFGYYLEVTRANLTRVPEDYVRKQTLANAERYFTPELKEWEEKVAGAEEGILELETRLFREIRDHVAAELERLQATARRVAELDVLAGLAQVAERREYARPEVHTGFPLEVRAGRHPVVETMMPREEFIPNDLHLDEEGRIIVLTGPNMAGKSTVLRQVGLIQLLAQMGSFVPADTARLPVCDRIFTRVGASDNLARGQSTFMVEMHETAAIIHGASPSSLVLLDEIGRGTSTYDGVSIAWAVTEHLHEHVGAKAVFATHYHELTQLGDLLPGCRNMNVAVREADDRIVFLRRLEEGGADRSYGIQVGRLAGLPDNVVTRAKEILEDLQGARASGGPGPGDGTLRPSASGPSPDQLSLFAEPSHVERRLREADIHSMTPLDALNFLAELKSGVEKPMERDR